MTITTIKKIIQTVINNCYDLDTLEAHEFEKISVNKDKMSELHSSINGGYYAPYENMKNNALIFHPTNGDIAIYKPVHFNNACIGYRFITYIDTALKTQLEVTAELMYNVNSIIYGDIMADVINRINAAAN